MNDLLSWTESAVKTMYPELFDDQAANSKIGNIAKQSYLVVEKLVGNNVNKDELKQLAVMMAAHMLYQTENSGVSSVQVADVHFQLSNSKNGSGNGSGSGNGAGSDPYLNAFLRLLSVLGINRGYEVKLG